MCRSHRLLGSDTGSANALPWLGSVGICLVMAFWLHDLLGSEGKNMSPCELNWSPQERATFNAFFPCNCVLFVPRCLSEASLRTNRYVIRCVVNELFRHASLAILQAGSGRTSLLE